MTYKGTSARGWGERLSKQEKNFKPQRPKCLVGFKPRRKEKIVYHNVDTQKQIVTV